MKSALLRLPSISAVKKHEIKTIFAIAVSWTIIDFLLFLYRRAIGSLSPKYYAENVNLVKEVGLRELNVFFISLIIGYFLVSVIKVYLRNSSLWYNLFLKTLILVLFAFVMNFFIYVTYEWLIAGYTLDHVVSKFIHNMFYTKWLVQKMPEWVVLFILTLLALEVDEKYSRGVFLSIMMGKYLQPKEERRIIMFLDLKDSTPIAQKLGHKEYFKFIRDFIYYISAGLIQHDARIYQYVGDEIVAWWPENNVNAKKVVLSLLNARKELNKNAEKFRRLYGIIPEYKAGIHTGIVTVGQIGIVKKDLVMSGDAINTAARIRTACSELNQKYLISQEMFDLLDLKDWQAESVGLVDLKGKNHNMELFTLKI
jgi:adenylate cyclase